MLHALYSVAGVGVLALAFAVLVATFLWMTRLLGWRSGEPPGPEHLDGTTGQEPPDSVPVRGKVYGATYGFILGLLACVLYWLSPLMLGLSAASAYYSGRAFYIGVRHFHTLSVRALVGITLALGSVVLHYLQAIGEIAPRPF